MGSSNQGTQTIVWKYKNPSTSQSFNNFLYNIMPTGIYKGGEISISGSAVTATPMYIFIKDGAGIEVAIKCSTLLSVTFNPTPDTPYIIARLEWENTESNYVDFITVAENNLRDTDIIFGKAVYVSNVLTSLDLSRRTVPSFLRADSSVILTAGEAIDAQTVCYLNANGSVYTASNEAIGTATGLLLYSKFSVAGGSIGNFMIRGWVPSTTLDEGNIYYLGADGALLSTEPTTLGLVKRQVGVALSATELYFNPDVNAYLLEADRVTPLEASKAWEDTYTYVTNEITWFNGLPYKSIADNNINQQPDTAITWWEPVVTGGGGGASTYNVGFNFENGQFETSITGWNSYKDAVQDTPEDGTGGTATAVTIVRNGTNPLNGEYDGLITKTGNNAQGEGISYDFTIDDGSLSSVVEISFNYLVSENYLGEYASIFVYDKTNNIMCPCSVVGIPATFGSVSSFVTTFMPNDTSNDYRFIIHISTSTTTAWTMHIDNIQVGENKKAISTRRTPWMLYPAATYTGGVTIGTGKVPIAGSISNPTKGVASEDSAMYSEDGEDILINVNYKQTSASGAAVGSGTYLFLLPKGKTIDLTRNPVDSVVGIAFISNAANEIDANTYLSSEIFVGSSTTLYIGWTAATELSNTKLSLKSSSPINLGVASCSIRFTARVTVTDQSINCVFNGVNEPFYLSNTESTVNTNGAATKTKIGIDGTSILANTNTTYYDIALPRALLPNETPQLQVRSKVDGNWINVSSAFVPSLFVSLLPQIYTAYGTSTAVMQVGFFLAQISSGIRIIMSSRLAGAQSYSGAQEGIDRSWAQVIAAADGFNAWRVRIGQASDGGEVKPTVFAHYNLTASMAPSVTPTVMQYSTKVVDTHTAVTTDTGWKFKAPMSGLYEIAFAQTTDNSGTVQCFVHRLYKNGVAQHIIGAVGNEGISSSMLGGGSTKVYLNAGEYIQDFVCSTGGTNGSIQSGVDSWIQIQRVGD